MMWIVTSYVLYDISLGYANLKFVDRFFQEWYLPFLNYYIKKIPLRKAERRGIGDTEL